MLYPVVLCVVLIVSVTESKDLKQCTKLFQPATAGCCVKNSLKHSLVPDDLKECYDMAAEPPSCEKQLCIARKKGFANPDGTLNKKVLADRIEKVLENDTELWVVIKDKCFDGDINIYAPNDYCDFIKMENCITVQKISQCKEFTDKAECGGLKELAEECVQQFVNLH